MSVMGPPRPCMLMLHCVSRLCRDLHPACCCPVCVLCRRWWLRWGASSTAWAASSSRRGPLGPTAVMEAGQAGATADGVVAALGRGQVAVVLQGAALDQGQARLGPLPLVVVVAPVVAMMAAHRRAAAWVAAWQAALVVHSLAWAALQQQQQQLQQRGVMQQRSRSRWGHAPSVAAC